MLPKGEIRELSFSFGEHKTGGGGEGGGIRGERFSAQLRDGCLLKQMLLLKAAQKSLFSNHNRGQAC